MLFSQHRVAHEVLGCSVEELDSRLTNEAFVKWIAYLKIKDERFEKWEWYLAQIPLVTALVNGNKKAKLKDFTMRHNLPQKVKPRTLLSMIATAFGAKVNKDG